VQAAASVRVINSCYQEYGFGGDFGGGGGGFGGGGSFSQAEAGAQVGHPWLLPVRPRSELNQQAPTRAEVQDFQKDRTPLKFSHLTKGHRSNLMWNFIREQNLNFCKFKSLACGCLCSVPAEFW